MYAEAIPVLYKIRPEAESILVELKEDMGVTYVLITYVKAISMLV